MLSLAWVASGVLIIVRSAAMRSVAASAAQAGMSAPVQGLGGPALVTATVLFTALSVGATTKRPSNSTMHPPYPLQSNHAVLLPCPHPHQIVLVVYLQLVAALASAGAAQASELRALAQEVRVAELGQRYRSVFDAAPRVGRQRRGSQAEGRSSTASPQVEVVQEADEMLAELLSGSVAALGRVGGAESGGAVRSGSGGGGSRGGPHTRVVDAAAAAAATSPVAACLDEVATGVERGGSASGLRRVSALLACGSSGAYRVVSAGTAAAWTRRASGLLAAASVVVLVYLLMALLL